jgi:hypothetical protein
LVVVLESSEQTRMHRTVLRRTSAGCVAAQSTLRLSEPVKTLAHVLLRHLHRSSDVIVSNKFYGSILALLLAPAQSHLCAVRIPCYPAFCVEHQQTRRVPFNDCSCWVSCFVFDCLKSRSN